MYSKWQIARKYLHYYITASNGTGHGVHSPFVFDFITQILNDKKHYPEYDQVEGLRKQLLKDKTLLNIEDLGAGSSVSKASEKTIASIVHNAAKSRKYSQLLFRMVKYYQPGSILELGTSLGITTSYLSLANPDSKVISLEGAKEAAVVAKKNFKSLGLQNVSVIEGNFDTTLSSVIEAMG